AQQTVVAKYIYDPFGNTVSKSGPLADANTYRFSSQEYHQPSGLSLYLYRAYDPNLQRWLNQDPIKEEGGINLFGFVGNNPISGLDQLGLWNLWNPATWGVPNGAGWSLLDSLTPWHESAGWSGFSLQTTSEADGAFLDGINPFGNPFANMGLYDPCDKALKWSRRVGTATRDVEVGLATLGAAFYAQGTTIVYSGAAAETEALSLAAAGEGTTILNTAGGAFLKWTGTKSQFLWTTASSIYGSISSSEAIVLVSAEGGSILGTVEIPILVQN